MNSLLHRVLGMALAGAVLLPVLVSMAGNVPANPAPANPAASDDIAVTLTTGRQLYNAHCYYCHGYAGDAKTLASSFLSPSPRDFTATALDALDAEAMQRAVRSGRPGTAMKGFADRLTAAEIEAVVAFIRRAFMAGEGGNIRYHSRENGWEGDPADSPAAPFAAGEIALDTPWEQLTANLQAGKRLFLSSCLSCHDRGRVRDSELLWDAEALSYPRGGYSHKDPPDSVSAASSYALHDALPVIDVLTQQETRGGQLFLDNCAFCHGGDGTGRNWIGSFMEPRPRDLTNPEAMAGMSHPHLVGVIRDGLPGTSMPAWKSVLSEPEIQDVAAYIHRAFHPLQEYPQP